MAAALRQIRSVNPKAVVLAYSTSDTIRWYTDLGEMKEKRVRGGEGERGGERERERERERTGMATRSGVRHVLI